MAVISALIWTMIIVGSTVWNVVSERKHVYNLAKNEAIVNFKKDQAFRLWGSKHGGVYVPATENTPSNKYLAHIPERDIKTPSGKQLTLMNPAYMIRQITDDFEDLYGVPGKITSLKVLNPINTPDEWEVNALHLFETGVDEVMEVNLINGKSFFRLMRPMVTKKVCLKCHAFQGYKVGDIRGGVNVSVPLEPYDAIANNQLFISFLTHGGIWGFGIIGIALAAFRNKRNNIERWEAEKEKTRLINILNESHNEIYIFDTENFYFVYANKWAQNSIGYTIDELKLKSFLEIQSEYDRVKFKKLITPLLAGKVNSVFFETNNMTKDGRLYPVETRIQAIHTEKDPLFVAIVVDITGQKEANNIKNTYEQLVHAEKLSAIGKLTGSIAHEFNNPLYGVTSILEQVDSDNNLNDRNKGLLGLAIKECDRMSNLIRKLRDFYRPTSDRITEIDVCQIIDDMLLLMDKKLMKHRIKVEKQYSRKSIIIKNMEDKIKQVILNIVQNAEEAISDNGGEIFISTDVVDSKVLIKVKDTGQGIANEDLENIFTPFFTTKGNKGTGLGLSVCYRIIKECGGSISATSNPGKGTCFVIELPLERGQK